MDKAKYIMIMNLNFETPIIFPNHIQHIDMMKMMGKKKEDIISAGFVIVEPLSGKEEIELASGCIQDVKHTCYGGSFSLGVESRKQDSDIVNRMYFGK